MKEGSKMDKAKTILCLNFNNCLSMMLLNVLIFLFVAYGPMLQMIMAIERHQALFFRRLRSDRKYCVLLRKTDNSPQDKALCLLEKLGAYN